MQSRELNFSDFLFNSSTIFLATSNAIDPHTNHIVERSSEIYLLNLTQIEATYPLNQSHLEEIVDFVLNRSYVLLDPACDHPLKKDVIKLLQERRRCGLPVDDELDRDDVDHHLSFYDRENAQCFQSLNRMMRNGNHRHRLFSEAPTESRVEEHRHERSKKTGCFSLRRHRK